MLVGLRERVMCLLVLVRRFLALAHSGVLLFSGSLKTIKVRVGWGEVREQA